MLGDLEKVIKICGMLSKDGSIKFKRSGNDYDFMLDGDRLFSYSDGALKVEASRASSFFSGYGRIKYKMSDGRFLVEYKNLNKEFLRSLTGALTGGGEVSGDEWDD